MPVRSGAERTLIARQREAAERLGREVIGEGGAARHPYHRALARQGRRGERKESGARYLETIEKELENLRLGKIVSVIARYWSLDREENWDRIEKTYRMLDHG